MTMPPAARACLAVVVAAATACAAPDAAPTATPSVRFLHGRLVGDTYAPVARDQERALAPMAVAALLASNSDGRRPLARPAALVVAGKPESAVAAIHARPGWQSSYADLVLASAAHVETAIRDGAVPAAAAAADLAELAIRRDRQQPEAWFNRALALDALGWAAWTGAWAAYVAVDRDSPWAREAEPRIPSGDDAWQTFARQAQDGQPAPPDAGRAMAKRYPARVRQLAEDTWLRAWATATIDGGDEAAATALAAGRALADDLWNATRDATTRDLFADVSRVASLQRETAARAVIAFLQARAAADRGEVDRARAALEPARDVVAVLPTLGEGVALLDGLVAYYQADYGRASSVLDALVGTAVERHHFQIAGRARFTQAAMAVRAARFAVAEQHYAEARTWLARAGDTDTLASALAIHGSLRLEQGDDQAAWELLSQALRGLPDVTRPSHQFSILTGGVRVSTNADLPWLALRFSDEALAVARAWQNAAAIASALCDRATLLSALGEVGEAQETLRQARVEVERVTDRQVRPVSDAQLARAAAMTLMAERPCEAAGAWSQAIAGMATPAPYQLARLYLGRAQSERRCGRLDRAVADYRAGIDVFAAQVRAQPNRALRVSHFDEVWDLYAGLATVLAVDRADPVAGLLVAEAGSHQRAGAVDGPSPDRLATLRHGLADDAVLVRYLVTPQAVLVWAVTATEVGFARVEVEAGLLQALVAEWRAAVAAGSNERTAGGRLYDLLVRPVAAHLDAAGLVLIRPDGPLHELGFAALWTGEQYLVERAAVWRVQDRRGALPDGAAPAAGTHDVLAVGDPAFDPAAHPAFARLPAAADEATRIAALYPRPAQVLGRDASAAAIARGFQSAEIVHIAAHAVSDLVEPERSFILTATGGLAVDDLAALPSIRTRIAVLWACRSASGRHARGTGPLGWAQTLSARLVPTVFGALWDLPDDTSGALALALHRQLAAGVPAAAALRRAQLALLTSSDAGSRLPRAWAAMVGLGDAQRARTDPRGP
jgi:CHAT domain-containing protein/tetratricopeptide (TPR) repeat protein